MKDKILIFIIGILIGAIITTSAFLIYMKVVNNNNANHSETMQMNENGGMEQPPDKPEGDNGEEPPEMPSNETSDVVSNEINNETSNQLYN